MFFSFDPNYFWFVFVPTVIISAGVQVFLQSTFSTWSGVRNGRGLTGLQTGQMIFQRTALDAIPVERTTGTLTDHYDPQGNIVRLSDNVANEPTVAAMAVTAHELGHVQQYQTGSGLIGMRNFLLPALRFSPLLSYISLFFGFYFNLTGLMWAGIAFFGLMVLFSLLTLPVELDASRRALILLQDAEVIQTNEDKRGASLVLRAAALTYLAAAITSVLQLFYFISLVQRRSR